MFVPLRRDQLELLARNDSAVRWRLGKGAERSLGMSSIARIEAARSQNLAWQKRRSCSTCSLERRSSTAQQTVDLVVKPQRYVRCNAGMVNSNLTANIRLVYHPLTDETDTSWGAGEDAAPACFLLMPFFQADAFADHAVRTASGQNSNSVV